MTLWEKLILPIAQGNTALQHLGSLGLDVPHHQLILPQLDVPLLLVGDRGTVGVGRVQLLRLALFG